MSNRGPECSSCSPGRCPLPNATATPAWCRAHIYDPEGALPTMPAVLSVWLGARDVAEI